MSAGHRFTRNPVHRSVAEMCGENNHQQIKVSVRTPIYRFTNQPLFAQPIMKSATSIPELYLLGYLASWALSQREFCGDCFMFIITYYILCYLIFSFVKHAIQIWQVDFKLAGWAGSNFISFSVKYDRLVRQINPFTFFVLFNFIIITGRVYGISIIFDGYY